MAITGIPQLLSDNSFRLDIVKAPLTSALTFQVSTPSVQSGFTNMPTPFKDQAFTPDKLDYGDFSISFKVDERLENYYEIFNWLKGTAFPNGFNQFKAAKAAPNGDGLYSDASLTILTNAGNPALEYRLKNIFPISLSGISLNSQDPSIDFLTAEVSFKVNDFDVIRITNN
jgi:hypothetical protein